MSCYCRVLQNILYFLNKERACNYWLQGFWNVVFELLSDRYSILAPNVIPQGFVDGKVVTEKVITALQLDQNEFRLGHTKIFFRAGVLGMLEDMRDERLAKIFSNFQARIRGYLIRKSYKKLQEQRWGGLPYTPDYQVDTNSEKHLEQIVITIFFKETICLLVVRYTFV